VAQSVSRDVKLAKTLESVKHVLMTKLTTGNPMLTVMANVNAKIYFILLGNHA
jgi:hypothetical protein